MTARPFLKWAGGKSQLLAQLRALYPPDLKSGKLTTYVEPFVGGGAVFFDVAQTYPITRAYLFDANIELVLIYRVVQQQVEPLIRALARYADSYQKLDEEARKAFYYRVREHLNQQRTQIDFGHFSEDWIDRAAMHLFLNKTCYNGLFRLNSKGGFNVPPGRYKNPRILDADNLRHAARVLQIAEIRQVDFEQCTAVVDARTFVYFDPPYRPLSKTAHFTSYSKYGFDDDDQRRLARFFARLHRQSGAKLMLSNSDPTNEDPEDLFFDDLYRDFHRHRVSAQRHINSKTGKRGPIRELVVTNYGSPEKAPPRRHRVHGGGKG
ncbi:MAG: DNA adenine methylase [Clostridia bacterium]|nr:MAG: DNA adenine methylase [Clostridia bacterium]